MDEGFGIGGKVLGGPGGAGAVGLAADGKIVAGRGKSPRVARRYRTVPVKRLAAVPLGVVTVSEPLSCLPRAFLGTFQTHRAV